MEHQIARPIGGSRWNLNQLPERQSSYKRRSNPWLGPGETDVFNDLPDDPSPPVAKSPATVSKPDVAAVAARTLEIPPIPSATPSTAEARSPQPVQKVDFSNPWQIHTLPDLWQFFHLWLTIIVGLEIHASMRLARLETVLVNLDVQQVWVALPIFGLLMLLNVVLWRRCKGLDYKKFFLPLSVITFTGILLAAAADLLVWMLR